MIIGLTGSIASGKSTVATMLKQKGFPIVDADEIARLVVEPGSEVMEEIERQFGRSVLHADGSLNREKMGEQVFGNEEARKKLNGIIHPAIRKEMQRQKDEWLAKGANTVILDIPLLFESKLQSYVDKILVVSVTPDIQKARLMERNSLSEQEAEARIQSQLPIVEKEQGADAVLHNNGTKEETERQLDEVLKKWEATP
ncbi:dephospho-CoA kinase [Sporosarcina sp. 179-K 3D1 HS]|uniref:dephospho-CoA kinase n=1 Tax=Sporosarcina sp. 179-K 3D1 HS TaxID=3232169 RepID=UPI0039A27946